MARKRGRPKIGSLKAKIDRKRIEINPDGIYELLKYEPPKDVFKSIRMPEEVWEQVVIISKMLNISANALIAASAKHVVNSIRKDIIRHVRKQQTKGK